MCIELKKIKFWVEYWYQPFLYLYRLKSYDCLKITEASELAPLGPELAPSPRPKGEHRPPKAAASFS